MLSTSDVSEPGEYRLERSLLCEGRVLDSSAQQIQVFAPVVFTHVMPRHCARLTQLSAQWLDCDGVVVTADGPPVPGFAASAQSRPVWNDGGFVRWLRDAGFDHQEPLELCAASSDARGRAVMR